MDDYIDLHIDIFDQPRQHAKVLRTLTIGGLVEEILKEFDDVDRSRPEGYALTLRGKNAPLDTRMTIGQLDLQMHDELIFGYARAAAPAAVKAAERAFLQEVTSRAVFEVKWSPALIGRASSDPTHNASLAVNLKFHEMAGHISRRQAQMISTGGQYFLEGLSANSPTYVNDTSTPITERCALKSGDRIFLSSNLVQLVFFHLHAHEFDPDIPTATLQYDQANGLPLVVPLIKTPFTIGRERCDLNIEDPRLSQHAAEIRYDPASGKFRLQVEGRAPGDLIPGQVIELSPSARVYFQASG